MCVSGIRRRLPRREEENKPFTSIFSSSTPRRQVYIHFVGNWICNGEKSCLQGISYARLSVFFSLLSDTPSSPVDLKGFFLFYLVLVLRPYDASRMKRLCDLIVSEVPVNESDDEYAGNGYSNFGELAENDEHVCMCVREHIFARVKNCE